MLFCFLNFYIPLPPPQVLYKVTKAHLYTKWLFFKIFRINYYWLKYLDSLNILQVNKNCIAISRKEKVKLYSLVFLCKNTNYLIYWQSPGTHDYPKLDTGISVCPSSFSVCHAQGTPLESETGWTGEHWSKTNLLKWQN